MKSEFQIPTWQTEMIKIKENVYAYIQAGGQVAVSNAGLIVGDKYAVLIDTLSARDAEALSKSIKTVTDKPIKYYVLTHAHNDHFSGSYLYPNAASISHKNCYKEMKFQAEDKRHVEFSSKIPKAPGVTPAPFPEVTFENTLTLHIDQKEVRLQYFGGAHTGSDIIAYLPEDNIVFCGDFLFLYAVPAARDGFIENWIKILSKLIDLNADTYVPGHGPICKKDGLIKCREYLQLVYSESKKAFNAGIPYREAALSIRLGEFKQWAHAERTLVNVYRLYRVFKGENVTTLEDPFTLFEEMRELAKSGW